MSTRPLLVNLLWLGSSLVESRRFSIATRNTENTQCDVLQRILEANKHTKYGEQYDFESINSIEEYQSRIPLTSYEDLKLYIDEMADGVQNVLLPGLPICFEPTSGSTSASKLIPYTKALQSEFQAGISSWIADMFRHYPKLLNGRAYWSISPATMESRRTKGNISIGFDQDTAYLNPFLQHLLDQTLAVPAAAAEIPDIDSFRYVTLAFLLRASDLTLISVWNPTFLTLLLAPLMDWLPQLASDLDQGAFTPPNPLEPEIHAKLSSLFGRHPKRAIEIKSILSSTTDEYSIYERLWPNLALISCWTQAAAKEPASELQKLFPNVVLAPKGLLATEGMVSFPLADKPGSVLSLRSHFFEFIPKDSNGPPLTAWELTEGEEYSVVLTTSGGLYRYQLEDNVRVTGLYRTCPCIDFVGKNNNVSDLYGEKLNEGHVSAILSRIFESTGLSPDFAMLAPDGEETPDHYTLFLAGDKKPADLQLESMEIELESALTENIHYAYCRKLGQLKHVDIYWIDNKQQQVWDRYFQTCRERGQKEGDIKPRALDSNRGWRKNLT